MPITDFDELSRIINAGKINLLGRGRDEQTKVRRRIERVTIWEGGLSNKTFLSFHSI